MQLEGPAYKEIEEFLGRVGTPRVALVEQGVESPAALADIGEAVRAALRSV